MKHITQVLNEIDKGRFAAEVSRATVELVTAIRATRKKGSVSITLEITPDKHDENAVEVKPTFVVKVPRPTGRPAIFFVNEHGDLVRENPNQGEMELGGGSKVASINQAKAASAS